MASPYQEDGPGPNPAPGRRPDGAPVSPGAPAVAPRSGSRLLALVALAALGLCLCAACLVAGAAALVSLASCSTDIQGTLEQYMAAMAGSITYGYGPAGTFQAALDREAAGWRLYQIQITVPPAKVQQYLQGK